MEFHSLSVKNTLAKLQTNEKGLSQEEADIRIKKYGSNELPREKEMGNLAIFLSQFNNPLSMILVFAGVLSVFLLEYIDAAVILSAVIINVVIGFIQENKANKAITKLKQLVEHKALVLRNEEEALLESAKITIGDIIIIKPGNRIPADARIIETNELRINESSLTGESLPSNKKDSLLKKGAALADRENMVYAGTMVAHGTGRAVVTDIGVNTELGKIIKLVKGTKDEKTPLQKRLDNFSKFLGILFGLICILIILVGLYQGRNLLEMIETGVAVGVASIPEGLTIAVTFILALGMQQILKKKALTRKLVAAETLGSTTVICTDKTGTLTEGKMHVSSIIIGEDETKLSDLNLNSEEESKNFEPIRLALRAVALCNDATVENKEEKFTSWKFIGSPTDIALLSASLQNGFRKDELLKTEPKISEVPFDSDKKFAVSLNKKTDSKYIVYEKGSPERILDKSTSFYGSDKIKKLDRASKENLNKICDSLTNKGLRVIGVAVREIDANTEKGIFNSDTPNWENIDKDLTFVGFIAIKDPLRPEAKETIKNTRSAGIRPIIITGDHKLTAKAIAEEVGLKVGSDNIITGEKLEMIDDQELKKLVKKLDVYARVSPHQKLRIIKALQDNGEVVAMTGDGINDSPALKAADIGISLGTGTDIAKETSDIVLLDDNFKTIVDAIKQGRIIFKNIKNVITYLLSDSFSEVILIAGSILFNMPLAILPLQILWINIVNDALPNFSLAFEKGDDSVMNEKPIKKNESILDREMKIIIFAIGIIRDLIIFSIFYYLLKQFYDIAYIRTLIFAIIGVDSLMYIFSIRNLRQPIWKINFFSNRYLIITVIASLFLLLAGIYWSPLQSILSTVPLSYISWLMITGIGFLTIIMIEAVKYTFIVKKID